MDRIKFYTDIINNDIDNFQKSYQQLMNFYTQFNHELEELNQTLDGLMQKHNIFIKAHHYLRFRWLNHRFHQHVVITKTLKLRFIILLFTTQRHFELLYPFIQLSLNNDITDENIEEIQAQIDQFIEVIENPNFFDQKLVEQLHHKIEKEITLKNIQTELETHQ